MPIPLEYDVSIVPSVLRESKKARNKVRNRARNRVRAMSDACEPCSAHTRSPGVPGYLLCDRSDEGCEISGL